MRNKIPVWSAARAVRYVSLVAVAVSVLTVTGASAQAPLPNSTFERPIGGGPPVSGTLSNDVRGVATRTHQYFTMDLPRAALSPQPLGPLSQFAPAESKTGQTKTGQIKTAQTKTLQTNTAESASLARKSANRGSAKVMRTAQARHRAVRLARRGGGNPLDAQALDVRIRRWPCDGGGICDWQNPPSFDPFQGWQSTRAPGGLPPPGPQPQPSLQYLPAQNSQYPFAFR